MIQAPGKFFWAGLIFAGKTGTYPINALYGQVSIYWTSPRFFLRGKVGRGRSLG
jgi:hypothetical protein